MKTTCHQQFGLWGAIKESRLIYQQEVAETPAPEAETPKPEPTTKEEPEALAASYKMNREKGRKTIEMPPLQIEGRIKKPKTSAAGEKLRSALDMISRSGSIEGITNVDVKQALEEALGKNEEPETKKPSPDQVASNE